MRRPNSCRSRWNGDCAWASANAEAARRRPCPAGLDGQRDRLSGLGDSAAKQRVRCFAWPCRCYDTGPFLDRVRFAGQRGFPGGEGSAFKNQRVGWNDVAGPMRRMSPGTTFSTTISRNVPPRLTSAFSATELATLRQP